MAIKKGTNGNDTLNGSAFADVLLGELGNDMLNGLDGFDRLYGGRGKDVLDGGLGDDCLYGGLGVDHLFGGDGDDYLNGGASYYTGSQDSNADVLDGGAGNDFLALGSGDSAVGGTGVDTLGLDVNFFEFSTGIYKLNFANIGGNTPVAIGAAGTLLSDTYASQIEHVRVFIDAHQGGGRLTGSRGDDFIEFRIISFNNGIGGVFVNGGAGDDTIRGSCRNDILVGGSGLDDIAGFGGTDKMTGGTGSDSFNFFEFNSRSHDSFDTITDFNASEDLIAVTLGFIFDPLPILLDFGTQALLLQSGTNPLNATTAAGIAQFLYETDTGKLSIDTNGSMVGGVILLCTLTNLANITAANIFVE